MGYDLHITRKKYWFDDEQLQNDISLNEWLNYIHNDPELQISEAYKIKIPQKPGESMPAPGFCDWLNHPQKEEIWFLYIRGNIETKNPDEHTIKKMVSIAKAFNAKVQGDEGEVYIVSKSNKIIYCDIEDNIIASPNFKKPWWKFW